MTLKQSAIILPLLIVTLALVMVGLVVLSSSSASLLTRNPEGNAYFFLGRQLIWLAIALGMMGFSTQFDYNLLRPWARPLLLITLGLLLAVLYFGDPKKGAIRRLDIGPIGIQPSELAKLAAILYLAESWSRRYEHFDSFWRGVVPSLVVLGTMLGLIFVEPAKGTAFFIGSVCLVLWFTVDGKLKRILPVLAILIVATLVLIIRDPYSFQRLISFFQDEEHFHIRMSKIALANGGWTGLGIGEGRQKMGFTPETQTDFIFSVYAEELGFIACVLMLAAFSTIVMVSVYISLHCEDLFGSLLAAGCGLCIGLQALLNIAVVTKCIPTTGISLPFISYGGSSLVVFMTMVGLIINVARSTLRGVPSSADKSHKRSQRLCRVRTAEA